MPLTDKQIKALRPEAKSKKYFDGEGLYIEVAPNGTKSWRLKYRFAGKEKRASLGKYPHVSLKDARTACREAKELLASGVDPMAEKKAEALNRMLTFGHVVGEWLSRYVGEVCAGTFTDTRARLQRYILPTLGDVPITDIVPMTILSMCRRIENKHSSFMAGRVLAETSRIFRYAVANGYIVSDPCRDIRDALGSHKGKNHPAFDNPEDLGDFLLALDGYPGRLLPKLLTRMLILLMCRNGELLKMRWECIDFTDKIWRIPAEDTKMRRAHTVPLPRQALDILHEIKDLRVGDAYVFARKRASGISTVLSRRTVNNVLRKLGYYGDVIVGHGFRATASTLLNEQGWSPDVIEAQLAHFSQGNVRAVYNRAKYLDERRKMLQHWADYLDELLEAAKGRAEAKK